MTNDEYPSLVTRHSSFVTRHRLTRSGFQRGEVPMGCEKGVACAGMPPKGDVVAGVDIEAGRTLLEAGAWAGVLITAC